jgi:flagellar hook-associated protein 2
MSGLALSGLVSGMDTTSVIQSLMSAASQPKALLDQQIATQKSTVSNLQSLNSAFAQLAQLTDPLTGDSQLAAFTASSSDDSVASATADSTASPGQLSFTVDALATRQVEVSGPLSVWPTDPPAITIVAADGTATPVTPSSNSLDDIVQAINAAGAGVTALKVQAGTDASGNPLFRLQLSSTQTGANAAFTVLDGGQDTMTQTGGTLISGAQDAQLTLWAGTGAAQTVTSASNEFDNLIPGVDVTAAATSTAPVTLTIGQDLDTEGKTVSTLVSSVQSILSGITKGQASTTTTDASGNTTTVFGPYTGDSTVRQAARDITDAVTLDVNGLSPSSIGINLAKDGSISFDSDAFSAAMAKDPTGTTQLFDTIVSRVNAVSTQISDPYDGILTDEISSDNDSISAMQDRSDDMQALLDQQQLNLQQQFAYMETMMSQINSQGSYLQSYISALDGSSSSSSSSK